jgi:hypothetical protein
MDWRREVAWVDVVAEDEKSGDVKRGKEWSWAGARKVYECRPRSSSDGIDRELCPKMRGCSSVPTYELAGRARRAITSIIEPHQVCPPTPTLSPKLT